MRALLFIVVLVSGCGGASTQPTESPPTSEPGQAPLGFWCTSARLGDASACYRSSGDCNAARDRIVLDGTDAGECVPYEQAICFSMTSRSYGNVVEVCGLSLRFCEATRVRIDEDDLYEPPTPCEIRR